MQSILSAFCVESKSDFSYTGDFHHGLADRSLLSVKQFGLVGLLFFRVCVFMRNL